MPPQSISEIIDWQWKGYHLYHASKLNLLLHIVFVPLFVWANVGLIASLLRGQLVAVVAAAIVMLLAFAFQGIGHKGESVPSVPFSSVGSAIKRILIEQWITFPKFVISGAWLKALRA